MTKEEKAVITRAVQWFDTYRPVSFSRDEHLRYPRINQVGSGSGMRLADAVAQYLNTRKKKK